MKFAGCTQPAGHSCPPRFNISNWKSTEICSVHKTQFFISIYTHLARQHDSSEETHADTSPTR